MSLEQSLDKLKSDIFDTFNTATQIGTPATATEDEVLDYISENLSMAIHGYLLEAEVECDVIVLPAGIFTELGGTPIPNLAPVQGKSNGQLSLMNETQLARDIRVSYKKIGKDGSGVNADSNIINENLGEDLSISIYRYSQTALVTTDAELQGFETLPNPGPPPISPASIGSGEKGIGTGQGGLFLISNDPERRIIGEGGFSEDTDEIRGEVRTGLRLFSEEGIDASGILVQKTDDDSDNSARLVAGIDQDGFFINKQDIDSLDLLRGRSFNRLKTEDSDRGLTQLAESIDDLANAIKEAYIEAGNAGSQASADSVQICRDLGENIGQAIHNFFISSIVKTDVAFLGGTGEQTPTSQTTTPTGPTPTTPPPETIPGGIGQGIGILK